MARIRIRIALLVLGCLALTICIALGIQKAFHKPNKALQVPEAFDRATSAYRAGNYREALGLMLPPANAGDANAQFNVAFLYAWGRGAPNDRDQVLNWYRCAAIQGDAEAQLRAGVILFGRVVEQSFADKAVAGAPELQSEAMYWLRRAAEQGNPEAQYDLAHRLWHDDSKAALEWLKHAANRDHDRAQFELGEIYRVGQTLPGGADHSEAAKWYLLAAERGNSSAQARLGEMLYSGNGTPADPIHGYIWLNLAAAESSKQIGFEDHNKPLFALRDLALSRLTPEQIGAAQRLSSQWHPQRSTANSNVAWREKPATAQAGHVAAPPAAYSHCENE